MQNSTHFRLDEGHSGIRETDMPHLIQVRQNFPRPVEEDVAGAVARELAPFAAKVRPGQKIGITGSSRGIANLPLILKTCVDVLRAAGAEPFIFPAMGSHGGATAEGQIGVLASWGVTEESVGCPIHSSLEVIQVGTTSTGFPVSQDKLASQADGVLVVNRVKPHTGFTERVESGLCKMMVIGMGKQAGASRIHQQALKVEMGRMVLEASRIIVESPQMKLLGGLAVVENAYKETAIVQGVPLESHQELLEREGELLRRAYDLLPLLPFSQLDALIVDEIGKNISGSGMDTNVIGKKPGLTNPVIGAIYMRGLTEETHGNAVGIGSADLMPRRLLEEVDLNSTYMNVFTAKRLQGGKIPLLTETELQAMQVLLNFRQEEAVDSLRLAWIRNTSKLDTFWVSLAMKDEVLAHPRCELLGTELPMRFDGEWNLIHPAGG